MASLKNRGAVAAGALISGYNKAVKLYRKARLNWDPVKSRRRDYYIQLVEAEQARQDYQEFGHAMQEHYDWAREKHWSMNAFGYGAFYNVAGHKIVQGFEERQKEWQHQEEMEDYWGLEFYQVMEANKK